MQGGVANPDEILCRMIHGSPSCAEDRLGPPEQPSLEQSWASHPQPPGTDIRSYGEPSRFPASIGSIPRGCYRVPSTARSSASTSRRFSCQPCGGATSSSWTISAGTRGSLFVKPSARPAPSSSSCRNTRWPQSNRTGLRQTLVVRCRGTKVRHNHNGSRAVPRHLSRPTNAQTSSLPQALPDAKIIPL